MLAWFKLLRKVVAVALLFGVLHARASHLAGDDFTYIFIDSAGGHYHYRVSLITYVDCLAGQPEAITQDNPAFFAVYNGSGTLIEADSASFSSSVTLPLMASTSCGITAASDTICVLKRTFEKDFYLPGSASGYVIAYQRCCKNAALTNISDPGDAGVTYSCYIPAMSVTTHNNSAVFTNYPPEVLELNAPFAIDHSATDADGDSLSYELCKAYLGATGADIKPYPPTPPPYSEETYIPGLSYSNPMNCSVPLAIDPVTGLLTGKPDAVGRYLITVCCHEWRAGVLVNTLKREFEFAVVTMSVSLYKPFAGDDTTIMVGDSIQFDASGAITYRWRPATYLSDSTISNPVGYFPAPGVFTYVLHGVSDSGCAGNDTMLVNVIAYACFAVPNAFTPNGDGINDVLKPFSVKGGVLKSFRIYNSKQEVVYSSSDVNAGWDGRYQGAGQESGIFFWELTYVDNTGVTRSQKGLVNLLR